MYNNYFEKMRANWLVEALSNQAKRRGNGFKNASMQLDDDKVVCLFDYENKSIRFEMAYSEMRTKTNATLFKDLNDKMREMESDIKPSANINTAYNAEVDVYEINYTHGILNGKTIYYTVETTNRYYTVRAAWDKYEEYEYTVRKFNRYDDARLGKGFTIDEVIHELATNSDIIYEVAEFVDMIETRFE